MQNIDPIAPLATAYGLLGESLHASGLVADDWSELPRRQLPRDISSVDLDAVALLTRVRRYLQSYPAGRVASAAGKGLDAVRALPAGENTGNYILTAAHLLAMWAAEHHGPTAAMLSTHAARIIDDVGRSVREVAGEATARQSYRIADNLYRAMTARPILDDAIRDAWTRRWAKQKEAA